MTPIEMAKCPAYRINASWNADTPATASHFAPVSTKEKSSQATSINIIPYRGKSAIDLATTAMD
jgi:phage terminase large subunit-like protein